MEEVRYKVHSDLRENGEGYRAMELPRLVVSGDGAIQSVGKVVKRLGFVGKALVVSDKVTYEVAGKAVHEAIEGIGFEADWVEVNDATPDEIDRVRDIILEKEIAFLLGVGGGKPIDIAKLSSYRAGIPFLSIPTAASHDGIVSSRASIMVEGKKESYQAHTPIAVIGDTEIICKAPHRLLAAGCGDIVSNLSAVMDWELAHKLKNEKFSTYASSLSMMSARMVLENADKIKPGHEPSARLVFKALVSSGVAMSIAGSSRPASGSEHLFSHALDTIADKPALHGEQCGVGTIMMMYLHGDNWQKVVSALKKVKAPTDSKGLGIGKEDVIKALMLAPKIRPERYTILSGGLNEDAALRIAENTRVIPSK